MSDIHMDFEYKEGSIASCGFPQCCRVENGMTSDSSIRAGPWGDHRCDTPSKVYNSVLKYMKEEFKPDAFILTGDNSVHDIWKNTRA